MAWSALSGFVFCSSLLSWLSEESCRVCVGRSWYKVLSKIVFALCLGYIWGSYGVILDRRTNPQVSVGNSWYLVSRQ